MGTTIVVAAETSAAGKAAVRHAGELARERDGVVHLVGHSALHADRASLELTHAGLVAVVHLVEGPLEAAVAEIAHGHDAEIVTTPMAATRVMALRPPRGIHVARDGLRSWSPPAASGLQHGSLAVAGLGGATVVAALATGL